MRFGEWYPQSEVVCAWRKLSQNGEMVLAFLVAPWRWNHRGCLIASRWCFSLHFACRRCKASWTCCDRPGRQDDSNSAIRNLQWSLHHYEQSSCGFPLASMLRTQRRLVLFFLCWDKKRYTLWCHLRYSEQDLRLTHSWSKPASILATMKTLRSNERDLRLLLANVHVCIHSSGTKKEMIGSTPLSASMLHETAVDCLVATR